MLETARLRLEPLDTEHLDPVHAIYSNPLTWQHLPSGRFAEQSRTEAMILRARVSWQSVGLGPWAVSLRDDPSQVIGTAGCAMLALPAWNLGYRLAPTAWGHGYASEAAHAALEAARSARPDTPVSARALSANPASIRVLTRIGLKIIWRGRSTECAVADPQDTRGIERVITADRDLDPELLTGLIDLG